MLHLSKEDENRLRDRLLEAQRLSYSPYSKFRVGCVVEGVDGRFVSGANIENASYGASICAERVAICRAVTEGIRQFKLIAIIGDTDEPLTPCGICRQFIREFGESIPVVMFSRNEGCMIMSLGELLPKSFGPDQLS